MTTMRTMTMALLLALASAGCGPRQISYDARASAEYQTAWAKKVAGDNDGYRAGLQQVASRYPDSRAGVRAREQLQPQASGPGMLGFFAALSQLASRSFGTPVAPSPAMPPAPTR